MKRSLRERVVIALSTVAYVFDELAKIVAPSHPHPAEQSNAELDRATATSRGRIPDGALSPLRTPTQPPVIPRLGPIGNGHAQLDDRN